MDENYSGNLFYKIKPQIKNNHNNNINHLGVRLHQQSTRGFISFILVDNMMFLKHMNFVYCM